MWQIKKPWTLEEGKVWSVSWQVGRVWMLIMIKHWTRRAEREYDLQCDINYFLSNGSDHSQHLPTSMKRNKPAENNLSALIDATWLILMGTSAEVYSWNRMKQEWARLAESVRPTALDWAAQLINVYLLCPMGFWTISITSHFESGSCHSLTAGAPRWHQLWISVSSEDPPSLTMLAKDTELHRTTQPMFACTSFRYKYIFACTFFRYNT